MQMRISETKPSSPSLTRVENNRCFAVITLRARLGRNHGFNAIIEGNTKQRKYKG